MTESPPAPVRRFVSLRWKSAVLLTVVLIVVNALVQFVHYRRQQSAQEAQWSARLTELERSFLAMNGRSSLQLERLASQFVRDVKEFVGVQSSGSQVTDLFTTIDALQYLTPAGTTLFAWEQEGSNALSPPALTSRAIRSIAAADRPQTYLDCGHTCLQHAFVPALTADGKEIIINASRSSSDAFVDFQQVSGADIALITDAVPGTRPDLSGDDAWGKRIALATHAGSMISRLKQLAQYSSLDGLRAGRTAWVDGHFFAVKAFDFPQQAANGRITALLFDDETASIVAMRRAAWENLALGALGMVLVGVLLGKALGQPMKRLQTLASALPRLAENRFQEVRASIAEQMSGKGGSSDEIDVLSHSATDLSNKLEHLQGEVVQHTEALQFQVDELDRARAFSELLLDTAPVVIVIHTPSGKIVRMNKCGHRLTGWSHAELDRMAIDALIEAPEKGENPLQRLRDGASQAQQVESALRCAQNEKRRVTWLHNAVENEQGRMIMSVGLDITLQRETESRLRWLAGHDAISDLLNRDSFTTEMRSVIEDAGERQASVALIIVDIDNFQDVNESYGHQAGDRVLAQLSKRLKTLCGNNAILGRVGSDEYAILQLDGDAASAQVLVERVGRDLADNPFQVDGVTIHLSTSSGIVLFPEHGDSTEELLANATLALAQARRISPGHGHILTLDAEVRARRRERMHIRDEVAAALADDRFALYYQPILDMRSYRLSHCESLVRMQNRDGVMVAPGAFIEVAEQSGQINAIQHVVLRKAIQMQAELQRGGHPLKVSINLAAKTFEDPHLVELVKKLVQQTGADPRQLIFEIVESEAIANMVTAQLITDELTTLGAGFAFDDFGVGFTSFEYLRELPVDYVKIDQSFMRNLKERETDRVLVRSMNEMIRRLGLKSVAEGVEDAWTLDYLRDIGVDYCQGYYISRPVPYPLVGAEARAIEERLSSEAGAGGFANVVTLDHAHQPG